MFTTVCWWLLVDEVDPPCRPMIVTGWVVSNNNISTPLLPHPCLLVSKNGRQWQQLVERFDTSAPQRRQPSHQLITNQLVSPMYHLLSMVERKEGRKVLLKIWVEEDLRTDRACATRGKYDATKPYIILYRSCCRRGDPENPLYFWQT